MMSFGRIWLHSLIASLGGLLLGCLAGGTLLGGYFSLSANAPPFWPGAVTGLITSLYALFFGAIPALLYGALAYAVLVRLGRATVMFSAVAGILPGLAVLPFERELGIFFAGYGLLVGVCTHAVARRWSPLRRLSPNNSSKPTPLRGAA